MSQLEELPGWPARMNVFQACAYVGGEMDLWVLREFFGLEGEPEDRKLVRFRRDELDAALDRARGRWPTREAIASRRRARQLREEREERAGG